MRNMGFGERDCSRRLSRCVMRSAVVVPVTAGTDSHIYSVFLVAHKVPEEGAPPSPVGEGSHTSRRWTVGDVRGECEGYLGLSACDGCSDHSRG